MASPTEIVPPFSHANAVAPASEATGVTPPNEMPPRHVKTHPLAQGASRPERSALAARMPKRGDAVLRQCRPRSLILTA